MNNFKGLRDKIDDVCCCRKINLFVNQISLIVKSTLCVTATMGLAYFFSRVFQAKAKQYNPS